MPASASPLTAFRDCATDTGTSGGTCLGSGISGSGGTACAGLGSAGGVGFSAASTAEMGLGGLGEGTETGTTLGASSGSDGGSSDFSGRRGSGAGLLGSCLCTGGSTARSPGDEDLSTALSSFGLSSVTSVDKKKKKR